MARLKKSRKAKGFIPNEGPTRNERLADPDSYDSRRRKAKQEKKKNQSVFEKQRQADDNSASKKQPERKTRLADKIRELNKSKEESAE
ncbi:hypothetical protein ACMXYO_09920 [Neptuniibacter sp. QD37_6]|uniref:hypothetical protein n=1 Tax=Neptuniibacter sp. QD37_6 TaxID=3398210 RepID=UPI0039F62271